MEKRFLARLVSIRLAAVCLAAFVTLVAAAPVRAATVLVFGDSLSAGYGIGQKESWAALLQERLRREKFNYTVANASISGETSAGGASRIGAALAEFKPEVVILALGANDGLRGLPLAQLKGNLSRMIREAQARGARVLLVGMRMPPNYGPQYTEGFRQTFVDLAKEYRTGLVPFMLEPIALRRELFQADNLHPTAEAQRLILDHLWPSLKGLLKGG